jgi:hypothetical protein
MEPIRRKLVWTERPNFQGWGCSECAWVFNPAGPVRGESLDELKMSYQTKRDKEFATHDCAEHARATRIPK